MGLQLVEVWQFWQAVRRFPWGLLVRPCVACAAKAVPACSTNPRIQERISAARRPNTRLAPQARVQLSLAPERFLSCLVRYARRSGIFIPFTCHSHPAHGAFARGLAKPRRGCCRHPPCRVAGDVAGACVRCIQLRGRLSVLVGNGREPTWDLALVAGFTSPESPRVTRRESDHQRRGSRALI